MQDSPSLHVAESAFVSSSSSNSEVVSSVAFGQGAGEYMAGKGEMHIVFKNSKAPNKQVLQWNDKGVSVHCVSSHRNRFVSLYTFQITFFTKSVNRKKFDVQISCFRKSNSQLSGGCDS